MTMHRVLVIAGLTAALAAPVAIAAPAAQGAQGQGWKKGQGWAWFLAGFDTNKDGKVSKEELLAKQPGFDRLDTNHDGFVTEAEYDALPASKNYPNVKSWMAKLDTNGDDKVSLEEWNTARVKAFEMADKNHDGFIEQSEFTPELTTGGAN